MNRRNWQIFGLSQKTKTIALGIAILIALVLAAWLFVRSESPTAAIIGEGGNRLTGALVQQQEEQQEIKEEAQQEVQQQEQEKPYYAYRGQCAFDMKQRQDDLQESKNVAQEYQTALDKLTAEYEQKKKELEEQYATTVPNIKTKLEKANRELEAVQQRYNEVKTACEPQP
ncbi:hypothetical protein HYS50_03105 [Candidatus Woesearchaeota archaeon]|nr:hypothetical protein [Candidatus Woesearchaeota archaeon]